MKNDSKVIGDCDTQVWINHPGEKEYFGNGRPSYFAGNGSLPVIAQNKGEMEVQFTPAFVPLSKFDAYSLKGNSMMLRKGRVKVIITADNGLRITEDGPLRNCEIKSHGSRNHWCISVNLVNASV